MSEWQSNTIPMEKPDVAEITRPWGTFRQYAHNTPCTVSLMRVQPGQRLSLQAHTRRSELWIVLDPGAEVTIGETVVHPEPGQELWIPAETPHRLAGIGDAPARVLEVAFGDWQQDDIVRYQDDYQRGAEG
jgi:mannose-1-phosphate guanylyltransferase/mannose-6-phosphate isomerase